MYLTKTKMYLQTKYLSLFETLMKNIFKIRNNLFLSCLNREKYLLNPVSAENVLFFI